MTPVRFSLFAYSPHVVIQVPIQVPDGILKRTGGWTLEYLRIDLRDVSKFSRFQFAPAEQKVRTTEILGDQSQSQAGNLPES